MPHHARSLIQSLAAVLAVAASVEGQGTPVPAEIADLGPQLAEMRQGSWDSGKSERAVRQLLAAGWIEAAGWWILDAEKALKAGGLPPALRGTLGSLREAWRQRVGADGFARSLGQEMAKHVRELATAKNILAAPEFTGVLARHLAVWHRFILTDDEVATETAMMKRGWPVRWVGIRMSEPVLILHVP